MNDLKNFNIPEWLQLALKRSGYANISVLLTIQSEEEEKEFFEDLNKEVSIFFINFLVVLLNSLPDPRDGRVTKKISNDKT